MTREGSLLLFAAAASNNGRRARVSWNGATTFSAITRPQPFSAYSSIGCPQLVPLLFTNTCSRSTCSATAAANLLHPASVERSSGSAMHLPLLCSSESRAAAAAHASFFLLLMITVQPRRQNASAIMSPMPRAPPVTRTIFPDTSKRLSGSFRFIFFPLSQCE